MSKVSPARPDRPHPGQEVRVQAHAGIDLALDQPADAAQRRMPGERREILLDGIAALHRRVRHDGQRAKIRIGQRLRERRFREMLARIDRHLHEHQPSHVHHAARRVELGQFGAALDRQAAQPAIRQAPGVEQVNVAVDDRKIRHSAYRLSQAMNAPTAASTTAPPASVPTEGASANASHTHNGASGASSAPYSAVSLAVT